MPADNAFPRGAPVWVWMEDDGEWTAAEVTGTPSMFPDLRVVIFPPGGIATYPMWRLLDREPGGQYPQGIYPHPPNGNYDEEP